MSDSVQPHRLKPTRLCHPWDSPGKNTGVGCHFLLQCVKVKSLSRVRFLATPWTAAYQAPLSMGFSRQDDWCGVPSPSPWKGYTWWIFFILPIKSAVSSSHTDLCPRRLASVVCISQALLPFGFLLDWIKGRHEQGRRRVRSKHLLHHVLSCKEVGWQ